MFKKLRLKIARFLASDYIADEDNRVNQRVAQTISQMDPFEPLLREYKGVFSEEFEKPEQKLDSRGQMGLTMWAYQQKDDIHFKYLTEWIMNSAGNETIKRAPITNERTQYGRAQIANMVLLKREIGRLSSIYEEMLEKKNPQNFDETSTVD